MNTAIHPTPVADAGVRRVHSNYHIPISNTAAGLMLFDNC